MTTLIADRLDQVFSTPAAAHCWHRLHEALPVDAEHSEYREAVARVHAYAPPNSESRFLRATFLHGLTNRDEYLGVAALAAKEIAPAGMERLFALLLHAWARALRYSRDRSRFYSSMAAVGTPELLRLIGRELEGLVAKPPPPRPVGALRRVAVVTSHVSGIDHAPTATTLRNIGLLRDAGIEAELFTPQECNFADMSLFLGTKSGVLGGRLDTASWGALIRGTLRAHIGEPDRSLIRRWIRGLSMIDAFDPDVVLFAGFISPLPYLLYPRRPLVGFSVHSLPPIIPCDVWLAPDAEPEGVRPSFWGDTLPRPLAHGHPFRVFVKPAGTAISREELKLPAKACVLISIGERLASEVSRQWGSAMLEFLGRHPDVHWLLVGGKGDRPPALAGGPTDRIRILPHHSNVRAICRCTDVFVNPPRMGGGFSVATAMAEGVPVVAYADSDGGDKLGPLACRGDAAYFETLAALVGSADLRQSRGAALQQRFFSQLDIDQGGPSLRAACEKAIVRFNERNGAAV
jgi:hypothetical protein